MSRLSRRAGVLAVLAALCGPAVACGNAPVGVGTPPIGFVRHADAVEFPSVSDWVTSGQGLRLMVPLGDCVLGVGTYANGYRYVSANWEGTDGCTQLTLAPHPTGGSDQANDLPSDVGGGWSGGGLAGDAVVVDGQTLIAASTELTRRRPDATIDRLAPLTFAAYPESSEATRPPHATSMTRSGGRLLVVGNGWGTGGGAVVFVSDDDGVTVSEVPLPQVVGAATPDLPNRIAAVGDAVVAVSFGGRVLTTWTSNDAGRTWSAAEMTTEPDGWIVRDLVRFDGRWLVLGSVEDPYGPNGPLVLSSADGSRWTREPTAHLGLGEITAAAVDQRGELVLVGVVDQFEPYVPEARPRYCGLVWTGPTVAGAVRGDLGCGEHPPAAVAALGDGRVLVASNRDLWIRG